MTINAKHPSACGHDAQERALACERNAAPPSSDPEVAAYRVIHRAIVGAPMPEPPHDFAARIAALVDDAQDDTRLESLLQRLLLTAVAVAAVTLSAPYLHDAAIDMAALGKTLPVPMLLATGAGLAFAAVIDRLARQRKNPA